MIIKFDYFLNSTKKQYEDFSQILLFNQEFLNITKSTENIEK